MRSLAVLVFGLAAAMPAAAQDGADAQQAAEQVSSLQPLVDELAPRLGPVADAPSLVKVYGPTIEDSFPFGSYLATPTWDDGTTVVVNVSGCAGPGVMLGLRGSLAAPGPNGSKIALVVTAFGGNRCGGGGRGR